ELLKNFGPELSDTELTDIRLRLEASGLRLVTYEVAEVPSDQAACRKLFKFGRKMGIETFIASPGPEALDLVEPLCEEFGINFAIINGDRATSAPYWKPGALVRATRTRSARVGACADVDAWLRSGVNPVRGVRTLGNRLITVRMQNLDAAGAKGLGRPAGMRGERFQQFLAEIQRLGIQPSMFGLGCRTGDTEAASLMSQSIEVFNAKTLELAARRNKIAQRRNGN
ncbi:MAG TPA: hypothetical protein VEC99_09060, partial [Clostridia bacterium]|nr:hypothetical protein [Clostridia bacterium]